MKVYKLKRTAGKTEKDYLIDYKNELNPQQLEAVANINGPVLVIAGAGSGKTRTLVYRVAYMVENDIPPESILLLTFTRKASQEMMRRAASILDERCSRVSGGTFHSFANMILRRYAAAIGMKSSFTIVDRGDAEDIIQVIRTRLALNKKERRFPKKGTIIDVISKAVNKCTTIEKVVLQDYPQYDQESEEIEKIATLYNDYKKEKQVMDYDDLLVKLRDLLKQIPAITRKICQDYQYIMVDEFQDTNLLQAEIALLLAGERQNIMVVGDDSQSIYSFRGANFKNIMEFPNRFADCKIITLEQNYRSTQPILELTNAIIEHAEEKFSKNLFSAIEGTQKPVYVETADEEEQSVFVAQRILELREEGVPLSEMSVLFRASWHANELEVELKKRNIPYAKFGGLKFAEAAHIKDVMSFLRIMHNRSDEMAWIRVLVMFEGIGPKSAETIFHRVQQGSAGFDGLLAKEFQKKRYFTGLTSLHTMLTQTMHPEYSPTQQLEAALKFYQPLFQLLYEDFKRRSNDLESLVRLSARYKSLERMLTDLVLEPPDHYQSGASAGDEEDEKLVLSTIHSAKGLEWHSVFIIHLVDGHFPSLRSLDSPESIEEERRLFYVAATRAKQNLFMIKPELESRSWNYFEGDFLSFAEPSRFISEIPDFDILTEGMVLEFDDDLPFQ